MARYISDQAKLRKAVIALGVSNEIIKRQRDTISVIRRYLNDLHKVKVACEELEKTIRSALNES